MISLRDIEKIMMIKELLPNRILHQPDTSNPRNRQLYKLRPTPKRLPPTPPIPAEEGKHIQSFIT